MANFEKYVNVQQITSITRWDKRKTGYKLVPEKVVPSTLFKKGYTIPARVAEDSLPIYLSASIPLSEFDKEFTNAYIENGEVYYCPHIIIDLSDRQSEVLYFNTVSELESYLDKHILNHLTTIKTR